METIIKPLKIIKANLLFYLLIGLQLMVFSCKNDTEPKEIAHNLKTDFVSGKASNSQQRSKEFKEYWYAGEAEISSYKLEQARWRTKGRARRFNLCDRRFST